MEKKELDVKTILKNTRIRSFNIHIEDSYKITKFKDMDKIISELRQVAASTDAMQHRTDSSIKAEWWLHNVCYRLGILRSSAKDIDINYPLRWIEKVCCGIVELFIRSKSRS